MTRRMAPGRWASAAAGGLAFLVLACGPTGHCALEGVSVSAPDPFPLQGLSADDTVVLHVRGSFDGTPGGFVGAGTLTVDASGLWTFDQFFATADDTADTAHFGAADCPADKMELEFSLTATDAAGEAIDLSLLYPPFDLTEDANLGTKRRELWDGVTIRFSIDHATS